MSCCYISRSEASQACKDRWTGGSSFLIPNRMGQIGGPSLCRSFRPTTMSSFPTYACAREPPSPVIFAGLLGLEPGLRGRRADVLSLDEMDVNMKGLVRRPRSLTLCRHLLADLPFL